MKSPDDQPAFRGLNGGPRGGAVKAVVAEPKDVKNGYETKRSVWSNDLNEP